MSSTIDTLRDSWPLIERFADRVRRRGVFVSIAALVAAISFWYSRCPTFTFPAPAPFSGANLYNPYADAGNSGARWLKMNLHAHSRAWGGITNGRRSPDDALQRYRAMGFDVAALSNYQAPPPAADHRTLSVYEQGYGLSKTHMLAVGARRVDWLDYPLREGANEKQDRIDRLHATGALVILAHPELRDAFTPSDLRQLTGYDAIEVVSHFGNGEPEWDAALGAGRLVWAVGNDDSHNCDDPKQTGRFWTMIAAPSAAAPDVIAAIRVGHTYAVQSRLGGGRQDVYLRGVEVVGDTIIVRISGHPAIVSFVGRDSRLLHSVRATDSARFVLPPTEPYARPVVRSLSTRLLLNPIVRTSAAKPPMLQAQSTRSPRASLAASALLLLFTL